MNNKRLLSVNLNQVLNLTTKQHGLVVYRQKIPYCVIVGNVIEIKEEIDKKIYTVTDYTSKSIEIMCWSTETSENNRICKTLGNIVKQKYCKIIGEARKTEDNKTFIVASTIEPLANTNEITIHLLEIIKQFKDLKKIKLQHEASKNLSKNGKDENGNIQKTVDSNNNNKRILLCSLTEIQKVIINLIEKNESEIGISFQDIVTNNRSVKEQTIKSAVDFLLNEGLIYTTIDENHLKRTE